MNSIEVDNGLNGKDDIAFNNGQFQQWAIENNFSTFYILHSGIEKIKAF